MHCELAHLFAFVMVPFVSTELAEVVVTMVTDVPFGLCSNTSIVIGSDDTHHGVRGPNHQYKACHRAARCK